MELRHLRYFVAIAEEQSFTRAAERLHIAQPGLSQQIKVLERELGISLFERLNRGVALTGAGRLFLDKARVALSAADGAMTIGVHASHGLSGHLRVGLSTHARSGLWPLLAGAVSERWPGIELTVIEAESDTVLRDLQDGRLDAAIVLGDVALPHIESALLREAPAAVALSERHRLARLDRIAGADLGGETIAISGDPDGAGYDGLVAALLESLGIEARLRPSGYGSALFTPVRAGGAVALVPSMGIEPDRHLAVRPLDTEALFRFELAWPAGAPSSVLAAFVDTCRAAATTRPAPRLVPLAVAA
jgi:DNA-binding transcriptional LysR family regulator